MIFQGQLAPHFFSVQHLTSRAVEASAKAEAGRVCEISSAAEGLKKESRKRTTLKIEIQL